jgi:xanthine dehydrogenase accessory factor
VSGGIFETLRSALLAEEPVALVTVVRVDKDWDPQGRSREASQESPGQAPEAAWAASPDEPSTELSEGTRVGAKLLVRPGDEPLGSLGNPDLDRVAARDALGALDLAATGVRHYGPHGQARREDVTVLVDAFARPARLVIFGAVDFTAALARVGKVLGFYVIVCDARAVFATRTRFPMADEVVVDWPHRLLERIGDSLGPRDAVCVLTHDPKFDVPAVIAALETRAGYLGAMGSRRTHDDRLRRLVEAGTDEKAISKRLMSPIGLDIGARTPEETAVSICAEIIASRTGRATPSLRDAGGPIHER